MTWLPTFWAFAILSVLIYAVLAPFFKSTQAWLFFEPEELTTDLKVFREDKAQLILALKELDFDYEVGKLSHEDYKDLRQRYEAMTVDLMKKIDVCEAQWKTAQERVSKEIQ